MSPGTKGPWLGALVVGLLVAIAGYAAPLVGAEEWRLRAIERILSLHNSGNAIAFLAFFLLLLITVGDLTRRGPKLDWLVTMASAALIGVAGYAALLIAPEESTMRAIQRIFYFHVPSAWTAFLCFFIVFLANLAYLVRRGPKWDWLGVSAAEVGVAFCSVVLVTGPIWAKPVWGVWWTWDARLTSTFVLWLMYVSYLLLRTLMEDAERRAIVSAVFGVFAFLDVPIVYMSIRWWRTQHPQPVIAGGTGSGLDPVMWRVFLTCWMALLGVMVLLLRRRYRLEALRHEVDELMFEVETRPRVAPGSSPSSSDPASAAGPVKESAQ